MSKLHVLLISHEIIFHHFNPEKEHTTVDHSALVILSGIDTIDQISEEPHDNARPNGDKDCIYYDFTK